MKVDFIQEAMRIGHDYGANYRYRLTPSREEVIAFQKNWYNKLEEITKFIFEYNISRGPLFPGSLLSDIWRSKKINEQQLIFIYVYGIGGIFVQKFIH